MTFLASLVNFIQPQSLSLETCCGLFNFEFLVLLLDLMSRDAVISVELMCKPLYACRY